MKINFLNWLVNLPLAMLAGMSLKSAYVAGTLSMPVAAVIGVVVILFVTKYFPLFGAPEA